MWSFFLTGAGGAAADDEDDNWSADTDVGKGRSGWRGKSPKKPDDFPAGGSSARLLIPVISERPPQAKKLLLYSESKLWVMDSRWVMVRREEKEDWGENTQSKKLIHGIRKSNGW